MAANQVDFKILPSDQFSVYSPATRSDKVITYFTLLSKLRGDILSVGQDDDPNNIVSAFYSSVGGTQTLHLVKADGSEVTASVSEPTVGTVTSVDLTAGTDISVSGGPITTSGSITVTNTAPDQVVVLTGAGTTSITSAYPSFTITSNDQFVGTVTSVGTTAPITGGTITNTGTIGITQSSITTDGYLSSANFVIFNNKQGAITLTTTGSSGAATFISNTLNIPNYGSALTGFVPYTGANQTVNLNTQQLQAGHTTLTTNGSTETLTVNHTSGSGIGINITKGGNNEGLRVNKTSGSGNAATIIGTLEATTIVKTGGTTSQFLKANGDVDSSLYYLASNPSGFTTNLGTVTSVNLTAGTRIEVAGGPVTTSGSITVTHGVAAGADFTSAQTFEARVLADGGIFEALGEVAIAIGSLSDAASPSSTDFNDGVVIQNVAIDEFGHLLGVGATDLDDRYPRVAFKNIAVAGQTTIEADAIADTLTVVGGTGISVTTNHTTDTLTITNTAATSIACFAAYSTQNLSLTDSESSYNIDYNEQSVIDSSFYTHSTTVDPEEITVLSAGKYEISMGYIASNGNSTIATVYASVAINGFYTGGAFSFLQLGASGTGSSVTTGFNTYIYDLDANDVITSVFIGIYASGSSGVITINPAGLFVAANAYITIKKLS